ncbi:hypothetical protein JXQ70_15815 [bacterium]|nr:hypothetical protein [bacterium]
MNSIKSREPLSSEPSTRAQQTGTEILWPSLREGDLAPFGLSPLHQQRANEVTRIHVHAWFR